MSNLIQIIKNAALDAGEAAGPCGITFGMVMSASPLQIKIDQKLVLPEEFFILTTAVRDHEQVMRSWSGGAAGLGSAVTTKVQVLNGLKEGDTIVLLRVQGGQKYIVLDRG